MPFDITSVLNQWESAGIFDYVLPFLLIFAVIFGILTATRVFGPNKGVHIVISLVVALLSLRIGYVQSFFAEVFPRLGVALAVIIVVVILTAAFIPEEHKKGWVIGLYSLGGIAALLVIFNSFEALSWFQSQWWDEWGAWIIGALILIGLIVAVSLSKEGGGSSGSGSKNLTFGPWWPQQNKKNGPSKSFRI